MMRLYLFFYSIALIILPLNATSNNSQETRYYNLVSEQPNICISEKTEQIGCTWWWGNVWDKPLIEKVYSLLKNENKFFVFLDVGAQTGCFTLLAKFFPNSKWYAFEPIKEAIDELNRNLMLNEISNVTTFQVCVSDRVGVNRLKIPKNGYEWGLATLGQNPVRFSTYDTIEVKSITLDNFVVENNIKKVDFIKIDTEGWELFVLRGGKKMIRKSKPLILMEFNPINAGQCNVCENDIHQILQELNYEWKMVGSEDMICWPKGRNIVF